jgi:hypothetical protein
MPRSPRRLVILVAALIVIGGGLVPPAMADVRAPIHTASAFAERADANPDFTGAAEQASIRPSIPVTGQANDRSR